jgi:hypothetical protein
MNRTLAALLVTLAVITGCSTGPEVGSPAAASPNLASAPTPPLTPAATPTPATPEPTAPCPSPAASSSTISTTGWVPFTSDRYRYTISYPPTHPGIPVSTVCAPTFVAQAKRDYAFGTDRFGALLANPPPFGTDQFAAFLENTPLDWIVFGPDCCQILFLGIAATVPAGTSVDDIISQTVGTQAPCESEPITIDGQPGRFDVCGENESTAVVTVGDRAYVFDQGRGSVAKDLMMAQLSTVQLPTP